ncbi:MAG: 3'-5' exonuclease domain-containing protein 2 [Bacteroidales bacterium]|nr:3'-5' exonuclease domain-containing protein 2 [Bacteroidales bacterium]
MYKISVTPEEIDKLPMTSFAGEIQVIDHFGPGFIRALEYLKKQKVVGFDTESRPCFSPDQKHYGISLLQLSGSDKAFLFRIKKVRLYRLIFRILEDNNIVKVGAACFDDARGLQKYHKFTPRNIVDLQKIVWEYGIRDKSVKKMAAIILGIKISKTQQLSNWEAGTLSESQKKYAATDAWVCLAMYEKLLASEKHPLAPEQLNPPQPQQEKKADTQLNPEKKRCRHRHRRKKPAGAVNGEDVHTDDKPV